MSLLINRKHGGSAAATVKNISLLLTFLFITGGIAVGEVQAQPITSAPDGTGTKVNTQNNRIDITGGTQTGGNLFHSFNQFGLDAGQIANFVSNPSIQNILGRVIGGKVSVINGLIQVTGGNSNLFLINPAGIIFGSNASLNLPADFTATTATGIGFGNTWFNAFGENNYAALVGTPSTFVFSHPDNSTQLGSIINAGNLSVGTGKNLTLLGGTLVNTGQLQAPGGQMSVVAVPNIGSQSGVPLIRLSQAGHVLSLEIQPQAPPGLNPLPKNFSALSLPELLTGGTLTQATRVGVNSAGQVVLTGTGTQVPTDAGTAIASGSLDVSGPSGGSIQVLGNQVGLVSAKINASGTHGGGSVLIGGDYQGQGLLPKATRTYVSSDSTINADSLNAGDGGRVIVWAAQATQFYGNISARGGSQSGNGGFVEVSGKQHLEFNGTVAVDALNGSAGTLLLDPQSITIASTGTQPNQDDLFLGQGDLPADTTITIDALSRVTGDVVLQADQNISFASVLSAPVNLNSSLKSLTFSTGGNFVVQNPNPNISINTQGANIKIQAAKEINIAAGLPFNGPVTIEGGSTLIGPNTDTTYTLTGPNAGTISSVNNPLTFSNIQNLQGGNGNNTFRFQDGVDFKGTLNGGVGKNNTLDYSAYSKGVTVNLQTGQATGTTGVSNFNILIGGLKTGQGGNTLIGKNGENVTFTAGTGNNTITGGTGGINTVQEAVDANIVLMDQSINFYGFDVNLGADKLTNIQAANLTGISKNGDQFMVSNWTGNAILNTKVAGNYFITLTGRGNGTITINDPSPDNVLVNGPTRSTDYVVNQGQSVTAGNERINFSPKLTLNLRGNGSNNTYTLNASASPNVGIVSIAGSSGQKNGTESLILNTPTTNTPLSLTSNGLGSGTAFLGGQPILSYGFMDNLNVNANSGNHDITATGLTYTGNLSLNTAGNITTSGAIKVGNQLNLNGNNITSNGTLASDAGGINLSATAGSLTLNGSLLTNNGGQVTAAANNNITSKDITANGGISLTSTNGSINTSGGKLDSSSTTNNGGAISLTANNIVTNTINTQGAANGGSVNINAGNFFQSTGSFSDQNGQSVSISSAGSAQGGAITIRHDGGNTNTPFIVGNASTNGTAAAITTGAQNTISPTQSFAGPYTQGNIQILTAQPPTPVPTPAPTPTSSSQSTPNSTPTALNIDPDILNKTPVSDIPVSDNPPSVSIKLDNSLCDLYQQEPPAWVDFILCWRQLPVKNHTSQLKNSRHRVKI